MFRSPMKRFQKKRQKTSQRHRQPWRFWIPRLFWKPPNNQNALSVDGTEAADQSDPALTGDSATEDEVIEETIDENADLEAADGDSVSPVAAAAKTIGTALTPGASFTVFSNPSSLQDFEQLTLQAQVIPSANSSNTSFGITFNFAYPYYASVYGLTSQSFYWDRNG